jgi:hypothetical protein
VPRRQPATGRDTAWSFLDERFGRQLALPPAKTGVDDRRHHECAVPSCDGVTPAA